MSLKVLIHPGHLEVEQVEFSRLDWRGVTSWEVKKLLGNMNIIVTDLMERKKQTKTINNWKTFCALRSTEWKRVAAVRYLKRSRLRF